MFALMRVFIPGEYDECMNLNRSKPAGYEEFSKIRQNPVLDCAVWPMDNIQLRGENGEN